MKYSIIFWSILVFWGCEPNEHGKHYLNIKNNTNERIYYWYSHWNFHEFPLYHYPDTALPVVKPIRIFSIGPNNIGGASDTDPDWNTIFSQLPEGLFTVYFFETHPETQEDWDELRNNMEMVYRKDTTLDELKANDYIIEYP